MNWIVAHILGNVYLLACCAPAAAMAIAIGIWSLTSYAKVRRSRAAIIEDLLSLGIALHEDDEIGVNLTDPVLRVHANGYEVMPYLERDMKDRTWQLVAVINDDQRRFVSARMWDELHDDPDALSLYKYASPMESSTVHRDGCR